MEEKRNEKTTSRMKITRVKSIYISILSQLVVEKHCKIYRVGLDCEAR